MQDFGSLELLCSLRIRTALAELSACKQQIESAYAAGMSGGCTPKEAVVNIQDQMTRWARAVKVQIATMPRFNAQALSLHIASACCCPLMRRSNLRCRLRVFQTRVKRSHLELRSLAEASKFGNENALSAAVSELDMAYHQLEKWYEEGHFLIDGFARIYGQINAAKDAIYPNAKAANA
jgi:flagellar biosynthesis chaperone FliJ